MNKTDIKKSSRFKIINNIIFTIIMIVMVVLIFITAQSKLTGTEPTILNHRIYIVDSGSMSPAIETDSMIIVKELGAEEIEVGDIITYYGHNKYSRVTHRVVELSNGKDSIITKGDANNSNDPIPLDSSKLIGKVVITLPWIGKVFRYLNTELGMAILITLMILWIVVPIIASKIKKKKENSSIRMG